MPAKTALTVHTADTANSLLMHGVIVGAGKTLCGRVPTVIIARKFGPRKGTCVRCVGSMLKLTREEK